MTAEESSREAGRVRFPAGQALRAVSLGIRLLPAALCQLSLGYRRFGDSFVREAVRYGIPIEAAREMAGEWRPRKFMQFLRSSAR